MLARTVQHLKDWSGVLALFLVIAGGTAYAADTIGSDDIIDESILSQDIKNGEVKNQDIANNTIKTGRVADQSLTGADVANQSLTSTDVDASTLNLATGTGNAGSCNDDNGTGSACVSTTVKMGGIGPITIHATGTWDTFRFDDLAGTNAASDDPDLVQGTCNVRFDGIRVGPVQQIGEADVSGAGIPTHPAGSEGTVALTARTIPLGGSETHTLDLFCTETDGDIDFHNLAITAQGSVG